MLCLHGESVLCFTQAHIDNTISKPLTFRLFPKFKPE